MAAARIQKRKNARAPRTISDLPVQIGRLARTSLIEFVGLWNSPRLFQMLTLNEQILRKVINIFDNFRINKNLRTFADQETPDYVDWHGIPIDHINLSGVIEGFFFYMRDLNVTQVYEFLINLYDYYYGNNVERAQEAEEYLLNNLNKALNKHLQSASDLEKLGDMLNKFKPHVPSDLRFEFYLPNSTGRTQNYLNSLLRNDLANYLDGGNWMTKSVYTYDQIRDLFDAQDPNNLRAQFDNDIEQARLVENANFLGDTEALRNLERIELENMIKNRSSQILTRSMYNELKRFYTRNPQYLTSPMGQKFARTQRIMDYLRRPATEENNINLLSELNKIDQNATSGRGAVSRFYGRGEDIENKIKSLKHSLFSN